MANPVAPPFPPLLPVNENEPVGPQLLLVAQIKIFLENNNETTAYEYLQTLLIGTFEPQEIPPAFEVIKQVLGVCSFPQFETCITQELSSFLNHSASFPEIQHDLALLISKRLFQEGKHKDSMQYAALAQDIANAHHLDALSAEAMQSQIFLFFFKTGIEKSKKHLTKRNMIRRYFSKN
jgi:hypothetical protein